MKIAERVATIRARLDAMPATAAKQLVLAVLDGAKLAEIDAEVVRDVGDDPDDPEAADRQADALRLVERGDAPGLGVLFEQVAEDVDGSWNGVAASLATLGESEASADVAAIAILLASLPWPELSARVPSDRLGRLALAAVAAKRVREIAAEREAAIGFLRAEAARFFAALHRESTDTGALAAVVLIRARDAASIAALTEALRASPPCDVSGRALVDLIGPSPDPVLAEALEALEARGFGRARG